MASQPRAREVPGTTQTARGASDRPDAGNRPSTREQRLQRRQRSSFGKSWRNVVTDEPHPPGCHAAIREHANCETSRVRHSGRDRRLSRRALLSMPGDWPPDLRSRTRGFGDLGGALF